MEMSTPTRSRALRLLWVINVVTICGIAGCATLPNLTSDSSAFDPRTLAVSEARLAIKAGAAAESAGRLADAARYYEQAKGLDARWEPISHKLAVLYDQSGDHSRAAAAYQSAVERDPSNPDLLNDFGMFHLHRERWTDAESWFRRALAAQPRHERARMNLGRVLAMQGRWEESFGCFAAVVGPAAAHSNLGVLLIRQGRQDMARFHLQQALNSDPTLKPAQKLLAQLDRDRRHANVASPRMRVTQARH